MHRNQYAKDNGNCCFNHVVALPSIDGISYPLFKFQEIIFNILERNQNVWVKKARGLGLTTFILRYLTWKILFSSELDYKSIYIVSGNGSKSSYEINLILNTLFEKRFPQLKLRSIFTDSWLKKTCIRIVNANNICDFAVHDTAYMFIDEADFLEPIEQCNIEKTISSYSDRSKFRTIMVSTPNRHGSLFEKIEKDTTSDYAKLQLDYRYGIGTFYDREFIEKKKSEPDFDNEYNIMYK